MDYSEIKEQLNNIKNNVLNKVLLIVQFVLLLGLTISFLRISQTGFKHSFCCPYFSFRNNIHLIYIP